VAEIGAVAKWDAAIEKRAARKVASKRAALIVSGLIRAELGNFLARWLRKGWEILDMTGMKEIAIIIEYRAIGDTR
jgi:hypothetical protein